MRPLLRGLAGALALSALSCAMQLVVPRAFVYGVDVLERLHAGGLALPRR